MNTNMLSVPVRTPELATALKSSAFTVSTILVAVALPAFIHSQWVTGPIVNAMLMIVTVLAGVRAASALALLPAPIALVSGLLPVAMAPMVPFIMLGNLVLIAVFASLYDRSRVMAVALAACAKFAVLAGVAYFLMAPLVPAAIHTTLVSMMGVPQLLTALLGGALALGALKALAR